MKKKNKIQTVFKVRDGLKHNDLPEDFHLTKKKTKYIWDQYTSVTRLLAGKTIGDLSCIDK